MNDINNTTVASALQDTSKYLSKLEALCSGKLFLAICIAHTCGTLYAFVLVPYAILSIIISVGLWLIYGFARKKKLRENFFVFKFLSVPMMIFRIVFTVFVLLLVIFFLIGVGVCIFSTHEWVINTLLNMLSYLKGVPEWLPIAIESFTWSGVWVLVYLVVFTLIVYLPLQIACIFFARGEKLFSSALSLFKHGGFENDKREKNCRKQLKKFTASLVALGMVCCFINLPMAVALFIAHAFAEEAQSFVD